MGNISRKGWTNGWEPNSDPIGGNPNGLLRMDNLTLDQDGVISLARGTTVISSPTLPGYINKLYSRVTAGTNLGAWAPSQAKLRYISTGGNVYRNYDPAGQSLTNFGVPVITGASDTTSAAFGTMYGQNIVCCGTTNVKDAGANQYPLTIPANLAPGVSVGSPLIIDAESGTYSSWVAISGGVVHNASSVGLAPDSTNPTTGGRQGEIQYPANSSSVTIDTTNFNSITLTDNPLDVFNFVVEGSAISYCQSITIRFLLQTPQAVGATQAVTDWYEVTFGLELAACSNTDWNTLTCDRQDFLRIGTTAGVYWNAIKGIQIILEAGHQGSGINIGNLNFCRQLTGSYSYYQVDVRRDTNYLEIGLPSPVSGPYTLSAGLATVTMHAPNAHATEIWLFRINSSGATATPAPYRVATLTSNFTVPFTDFITDQAATELAITDATATMRQYAVAIPSNIKNIICPTSNRALYFDQTYMYVSYQLDFGSYDSRHGFQIVDNDNEQILWTEWVVDGYILVGTTRDIYKIYSTFAEDSNGVISISIQGMGLTQPPISSAVIKWGTFIVYLSSEGWKYIAGSVVENFSQQLDLLYRGFSRQGLNALQTPVGNIPVYSCAQSHNHLYASVVDTAGNNVLHIYNFNKKTWEFWSCTSNQPGIIYAEEDGTVIYGANSSGDFNLRQFDTGTLLDSSIKQSFTFTTVFDSNGAMNMRKEPMTCNFTFTGTNVAGIVTINSYNYDGTLNSTAFGVAVTSGLANYINDISVLGAPVYIQVSFTGTANTLQIEGFDIQYMDHAPMQTTLNVPSSNFGTAYRKRIRVLPYVFDTLGNNVLLYPIADGVQLAPYTFNSGYYRRTALIPITVDAHAVDWGLYAYSANGPFEYYGAIQPYMAQMIPPVVSFWQIGPIDLNNTGTIRKLRIRMWPNGNLLSFNLFAEDNSILTGSILTVAGDEDTYEFSFPMGYNASVARVEIAMPEGFSYYYSELWTRQTGAETEWQKKRV